MSAKMNSDGAGDQEKSEVGGNQSNSDQKPAKVPYHINGKPIEEFTKEGFGLIVEATKCTNAFPSGAARNLYSAYTGFNNVVDAHANRILSTISKVIKLQNIKGNIQRRDNDEKLELVLECNDVMLERINSNLDILAGIRKNEETVLIETEIKTTPVAYKQSSGSWNEKRKKTESTLGKTATLLTAKNIVRPQISFKTPVDNSAHSPFVPQIKYKPHSIKPLAVLPEYDDDGNVECYTHPYEFELSKFTPSESQLAKATVQKPADIKTTPLVYVENETELKSMVKALSEVNEIAVDVEHHSYRTFQGITCLLQISTRTHDYIVDTLTLRDELHALNEVFTNPKVVKVFHGADSDVEWLQRDLSIYIVNMFDTHQAAKRLGFARLSLAFLLKHFCQIDADKSLQLADWRMRPLPAELILYARQDTHYLLYIYDMLRNELLAKANGKSNLLQNVYQSSTEVCSKRYVKLRITPDSHMELYRKSKRIFDNRQLFALKELFSWRDHIARIEDESYAYVLPNHMMLQIAENIPREMQGILACCNPIPPLVRQHLHVLHRSILKAREQPLTKVIHEDQVANRSTVQIKNQDLNGQLYCPHDLSGNTEFRDDLPTLIGGNMQQTSFCSQTVIGKLKVKGPTIKVFHLAGKGDGKKANKGAQIKFVSPYARYLAVLPFAEQQRQEELAKAAEESRKRKLCPDRHVTIKPEVTVIPDLQPDSDEEQNNQQPFRKYDKKLPAANGTNAETDVPASPEPVQPAKKRRIEEVIDAKLSAIRQSMESADQPSQTTQDCGNDEAQEPNNSNKKNKKKNKKNNKKNGAANNATKQSSGKPVEFDYSKVDYKQFQGGSQKPKPETEFKSKFHGKGKNNKSNKQFNKMLTKNFSVKRK